MFLAKYDSALNCKWAIASYSPGTEGKKVVVDKQGNPIVLAEYFLGPVSIGNITLPQVKSIAHLIAKFDKNGNCLWAKSFGDHSNVYISSIAVDNSNNIYLLGAFSDTAIFDNDTLMGQCITFLAKYSPSGNLIWIFKSNEEHCAGAAKDIAIDNQNNIYIIGYFGEEEGFFYFYDTTYSLGNYKLTSYGGPDIFLAKFDTNGNVIWAKQIGGPLAEYSDAITTDKNGNVYFTGGFSNPAYFGDKTVISPSNHNSGFFVAKYNPDGNCQWVNIAYGVGEWGYSLAMSSTYRRLSKQYLRRRYVRRLSYYRHCLLR
jgi:hypothetical protein